MHHHRSPVRLVLAALVLPLAPLAALALGGCTSGGGSGGDGTPPVYNENGPVPPSAFTSKSANGAVLLDWTPVSSATSYYLTWDATSGFDPALVPPSQRMAVPAPPAVISGVVGRIYARVASVDADGQGDPSKEVALDVAAASPERYFPSWADVPPKAVIPFSYDGSKTTQENGAALAAVLHALLPGDRLEIGTGTYTMTGALRLSISGTAGEPITIAAASGARPVIARQDASQNTLEVGSGGPTRFVAFHGLEITGGDIGLRLYDASDVWFDRCEVHHTSANAIAANSNDTARVTFTRCEVHHTAGAGEGFYIGANNGAVIARDWVVALNHVYQCGGSQGDGIEVKQGSYGNLIAENLVHDTNYPCILVYGTGGKAPNRVEGNVCFRSNDNVMQVQGEAVVRNNVAFDGQIAFHSGDHQGSVTRLVVEHNTFLNDGTAVNLNQWGGKAGMVFANNACYSQGTALRFGNGASGVEVSGNVVFGSVLGVTGGYALGGGLSDFEDATFTGTKRNVTPTALGALAGAADPDHATLEDQTGALRVPPYDAGAVERP